MHIYGFLVKCPLIIIEQGGSIVNVTKNKRCEAEDCDALAENQCDDCKRWYCSACSSFNKKRKVYFCEKHVATRSYTWLVAAIVILDVILVIYFIVYHIH